jgi:hypothetical protein
MIGQPSSDFTFGREGQQTAVISHVDQEVCDPGCIELFNRSINITWELLQVSFERANKHLAALSGGNAEAAGTRTTPVLFPGKMKDLMTPVLPSVGRIVGKNGPGRPTAVWG